MSDSRTRRKAALEALEFFKERLFGPRSRIKHQLSISIKFCKLDALGYCEWLDTHVRPREFQLELSRNLNEESVITVVAHEMVHVWQLATGKMRYLARDWSQVKFGKQAYPWSMAYMRQPWELEAHAMEKALMREWRRHKPSCKRRPPAKARSPLDAAK